jgi:hypothetical protein
VSTATRTRTATKWTCARCGVAVGRMDGAPVPFPETWARERSETYCLGCRRDRAATAALDDAPEDSSVEVRAKLRRAALIEFEVSRRPDHNDGAIARACRSSVSAVAAARQRLELPAPKQTLR